MSMMETSTPTPTPTPTPTSAPPPTPTSAPPPTPTTPTPTRTGRTRIRIKFTGSSSKKTAPAVMTPNQLLADPKSPVAYPDVDIRKVLSNPAAWKCLDVDTQRLITELMPDGMDIADAMDTADVKETAADDAGDDSRAISPPDMDALRNNDNFRHDAVQYQTNLASGRHDHDWLQQASDAGMRRASGRHDAFLEEKFERDFETQLPDEYRRKRDA